jgi:cytoskeletal protein RodZ
MEQNTDNKPKRKLNPDKPASNMDALRPPDAPVKEKKLGMSALVGRASVGLALLAFGGVLIYFMLPKGKTPVMAIATQVPAVPVAALPPTDTPKTQAAAPTSAKMVELKPVATDVPKATATSAAPKPTATASAAKPTATTAAVVAASKPANTENTTVLVAKPAADAPAGKPNPLFGPKYDPKDGKPVLLCAADPSASHLTLLQVQAQGLDVKNNFHLGNTSRWCKMAPGIAFLNVSTKT